VAIDLSDRLALLVEEDALGLVAARVECGAPAGVTIDLSGRLALSVEEDALGLAAV
jgi:hypothetical protein